MVIFSILSPELMAFSIHIQLTTHCFHKRTIRALWRTRTLNLYQKEQLTEEHEDQEGGFVIPEDFGSILDDEVKMSKIYSAELPIRVSNQLLVSQL